MSTFKASIPVPKYDTGDVVAWRSGENDTWKYNVVYSVQIIWVYKAPPKIVYSFIGSAAEVEERFVSHEMRKRDE